MPKNKQKSKQISLKIPEEVYNDIQIEANEQERSLAQMIRIRLKNGGWIK